MSTFMRATSTGGKWERGGVGDYFLASRRQQEEEGACERDSESALVCARNYFLGTAFCGRLGRERVCQKSFSISQNKIRRLTIFFSAEARPTVFLRLCQRRLRLQSCCEARRRQVPAEGCCGDGGIRRGVGSHCRGCGERSGVSTVAICK